MTTQSMNQLPRSVFKFMKHFVAKQSVRFLLMALISSIWALNESVFPYFIKRIINVLDQFHGSRTLVYPLVKPYIIGLLSFFLLMSLSQRLGRILYIHTVPKMRAQITQAVYTYVRKHSHSYFINHFAGNIARKIQAMPASCENIIEIMIHSVIGMVALLVFSFGLMWNANHIFAGMMLVWVVCHFSIVIVMMRKGHVLAEAHADAVSTLSGKVVDCISNIQNVRLFARGAFEHQYLREYLAREVSSAKSFGWHSIRMNLLLSLLTVLFVGVMVSSLVYYWAHHQITLGDFSLICMLSFSLLGMMWFMSFELTRLVREIGVIASSLQLIHDESRIKDLPNAPAIKIHSGEIEFDQVIFQYHSPLLLFNKLSVVIEAGTKVGLVGYSGSGKSTFVNLIMRFYDLEQGKILIDKQHIAKVMQQSLCEQIAMIPQNPTLFHRSLLENIRYGDIHASDEEVVDAAKAAYCHDFIMELDQGYDTLVGEGGVKLSGGQRQRIAIARGLLKNAPILILDEATSSLDTVTEKLIQRSLAVLMSKRTTLVVAHRLSTLTKMDRILVFDRGEIIEDGDMETLLRNQGPFYKLWHMQREGVLPDQ